MSQIIDELNKSRLKTLDMSRAEAVDRQNETGKLTARARNKILFDSDSFFEYGQLVEPSNIPQGKAPADGVITGVGRVDGRPVAVINYDFTVLGGSQGWLSHDKTGHVHTLASEQSIPIVYLLDGGGGRAQDMGAFGYRFAHEFYDQVHLSGWVPLVGAVMGPCFAGHANFAGMCDFVTMNKNTASIGVGGSHLVRASLSQDVSPRDLGGSEIHAKISGVVDRVAENDEEAIAQVKEFLSFMPTNAGQAPPIIACDDPIDRRAQELLDIVPVDMERGYDMYKVIRAIVDNHHIFDLKPDWARNIITCLTRLGGRPVGIVASQPLIKAGVIDAPAAEKMSHFVEMCDAFNIPLILLADIPGLMVGPDHERTGLVRRGMKIIYSLGHCTVPVISLVIRKAYGMGGYVMGSRGYKPNLLLGWPTAELGGMGIGGAVEILHRQQIADSENPDQFRRRLVEEMRKQLTAIPTAKNFGLDDVIDPRDTRQVLIKALEIHKRKAPSIPPKKHGIMPI